MDITACVNYLCPLRYKCLRYMLVYEPMQSVSSFQPEEDKCFIKLEKRDTNVSKLDADARAELLDRR